MTHASLNEEAVKRLPAPSKGNRITYFAGATIQGAKAPRGFGVRVTATGARAFVLNYRLRGREYRLTIGAWPDWSALKAVHEARKLRQRIDRGKIHLMVARRHPFRLPSPTFSTTLSLDTCATASSRYASARPMNTKVPSTVL